MEDQKAVPSAIWEVVRNWDFFWKHLQFLAASPWRGVNALPVGRSEESWADELSALPDSVLPAAETCPGCCLPSLRPVSHSGVARGLLHPRLQPVACLCTHVLPLQQVAR